MNIVKQELSFKFISTITAKLYTLFFCVCITQSFHHSGYKLANCEIKWTTKSRMKQNNEILTVESTLIEKAMKLLMVRIQQIRCGCSCFLRNAILHMEDACLAWRNNDLGSRSHQLINSHRV